MPFPLGTMNRLSLVEQDAATRTLIETEWENRRDERPVHADARRKSDRRESGSASQE
jgi:hypothetical protein